MDVDFQENFDIDNFDNNIKMKEINKRIEITDLIINHIKTLFEDFQTTSEELLDLILEKFAERKSEDLKKFNNEYYEKMNILYKKIKTKDLNYYYFDYEDFILIFTKIVQFYTQLNIAISFTDLPETFIMQIFGDDEKLSKLAEKNEYELQMKFYGLKYQYFSDLYTYKRKKYSLDEINDNQLDQNFNPNLNEWIPLKFSELDINNVLHWPPYTFYTEEKEEKFQRYEKDDSYHECNIAFENDKNCNKCSKFRKTDKIRIIYDSFDKSVNINYMIQKELIKFVMFKRNFVDYGDKLNIKNFVFASWNIFSNKSTMNFIQTIRNFYGEDMSYYFLWITDLMRWTLTPLIISIFVYFFGYTFKDNVRISNEKTLLLFSALMIIWGAIFVKQWEQKEIMFNYFWGTKSIRKKNEPDDELFIPDGKINLIFDHNFPLVNKIKKYIKTSIIYIILIIMLLLTLLLVYFIFSLKSILLEKYPNKGSLISTLIATLNTFQIKTMYYAYWYAAYYLNLWQNHKKNISKRNSLAIKLVLFEVLNCYMSIFYIAFLKRTQIFGKPIEVCYGFNGSDSCFEEMEIQLYVLFIWYFAFDFIEVLMPIFYQSAKMVSLKKKFSERKIKDVTTHSIEQQILCDTYDDMIYEYSEILVHFGFILLFNVAAPFTSICVFLLIYLEKFFDSYKIFFLERINFINKSSGLGIYNKMTWCFIYIGIFLNGAILFFGDNSFFPDKNNEEKIVYYCIFSLVIYVFCWFLQWNAFPKWFSYLNDIVDLYHKKYFQREEKNLPHYSLLEKIKSVGDEKQKNL